MALTGKLQNFLGAGLVFPIKLTNLGRPNIDTGFELIRSSIQIILAYLIGTRFMLGEFGSKLELLLEQPNDKILEALVRTHVIDAITRWEKRVETLEVRIEKPPTREEVMNIFIHYKIKDTKIEDSFIFPYYSELRY